MSDTVEWRWVDVDGKQAVVRLEELSALIASESLPPFALVWRSGWASWLAAANVPELLKAVGIERAGPPTLLQPDPAVKEPPSPPLERYRGVTQTTLLGAPRQKPMTSAPPPPPRPRQRSLPPPPPKQHRVELPSVPPPLPFPSAPIPIRDVQPTLAGEEPTTRSQTLRPVGALPPPPRSLPQQRLPAFADASDAGSAPAEVVPDAPAEEPAVAAAEEGAEGPPRARSVPPPMPKESHPPPEPSSGSPVTSSDRPRLARRTITMATAASLLIPGTAAILAALLWPSKKHEATPVPATNVVTLPPQTATAPTGCTLTDPARRLETTVYASVPLLTARAPDGAALVGFAASKEQAFGISIDPTTLQVTRAFEQTVSDSTTLGVVPLVLGNPVAFGVDRAEKAFSFSRTVDAVKRFAIGVAAEGFSRRVGPEVTPIWPGRSENPTITTPRVARIPGKGYAVAFRHGGQEGKVLVGYLTAEGEKASDLKAVATDASFVGTPSLAVNERSVLVAFAAKKTSEEPFSAVLSAVENGALPERATPFAVPPGGPGGEVISPSAEGLSAGRFLLQWTEGSAGNRAVRVQAVSSDLVPVGDPITLSNHDQNAGQGALWVNGERALALFLVKNDSAHELWGAGLKCP